MFERLRGWRGAAASDRFVLSIETDLEPDVVSQALRHFEPWSHRIDFSNGISTRDLAQRRPFAENTLQKFALVERHVNFDQFQGGTLLDVGCNSGYNSIHAARTYGIRPTGIDVVPRHIEAARYLAAAAGVDCEFYLDGAETFKHPETFDIVLHFGTLYHLQNPLLSLSTAFANLRAGGYLALETQVYEHPADDNICYFMHLHNKDATNFWALSPPVLENCLALAGFVDIKTILKVRPKGLARNMARMIVIARKSTLRG